MVGATVPVVGGLRSLRRSLAVGVLECQGDIRGKSSLMFGRRLTVAWPERSRWMKEVISAVWDCLICVVRVWDCLTCVAGMSRESVFASIGPGNEASAADDSRVAEGTQSFLSIRRTTREITCIVIDTDSGLQRS